MPALQRESCSGPFRAVPGCCARGVGMDVTSSEVTATTHSAELRFFLIAVARSPVHSELLGTWGYYLFLPASERCPKAIQSPGSPAPRLRPPRQQGRRLRDATCHTTVSGKSRFCLFSLSLSSGFESCSALPEAST